MLIYTLRRLASAIPTVFIIITLTFFMIRAAPGGPFDLERPIDPLIMANLNKAYNLDAPLVVAVPHLSRQPAARRPRPELHQARLHGERPLRRRAAGLDPARQPRAPDRGRSSARFLGAWAAIRQNSAVDYAVVGLATFGITTPTFVVAPLLSLFFGVVLGWLPAGGWSNANPAYWVLPIVTLALPQVAVIARLVRGSTIEALRSNHVRTARAYGLPTRVVVGVHALRAAMLPAVSYLGPTAAGLLTGSVVVETIFGIPGIGRYFVQGALGRDYTLVMGTVVVIAVFVIVFNLVVDLVYAWLDPRVRYD